MDSQSENLHILSSLKTVAKKLANYLATKQPNINKELRRAFPVLKKQLA